MFERLLKHEDETLDLAGRLGALLAPGDLVALEGDLGAGKTTFCRGAIRGLEVPETTPVTSPTFALVHEYRGRLPVIHTDFYRLADEAELEELGLDESLERGAVLLVEWGRKFSWVTQRATLFVELEIARGDARRLCLLAESPRGRELIEALGTSLPSLESS